jgi:hypothetical protein
MTSSMLHGVSPPLDTMICLTGWDMRRVKGLKATARPVGRTESCFLRHVVSMIMLFIVKAAGRFTSCLC